MDPLSSSAPKRQIKTPQSFLGENSGLVNLDQLINAPSNVPPTQPYNPFGDVAPPKTNLFQQQAQPVWTDLLLLLLFDTNRSIHSSILCITQVPSINQLKQTPFPVTMNQDPWMPTNTNNVNQVSSKISMPSCIDINELACVYMLLIKIY